MNQMTCIRILEILPVILENLRGNLAMIFNSAIGLKWLCDLIDWGKSSLPVVVRYWKQTFISLLGLLKGFCSGISALAIVDIEKLISCGEFQFILSFLTFIVIPTCELAH